MSQSPFVDLDALSDLQTPWCLHVVVTLRIAEHLASGVTRIAELAEATASDRDALHAVLGYLVQKGIFEEPERGQFALNEPARKLLRPSRRIGLDLDGIGGRMAFTWSTLPQYVRSGRSAYHQVFGRPFWEDLDANPGVAASFDALMGPVGHGTPDPSLLLADDWEAIRSVVDVGGGTGALLAEILRAHPEMHGSLVDLPRTVERALETFRAAGVAERAQVVGQSFFDPLPAGADLYVVVKVLNDWPDADVARIVARLAAAARPNGRVAISGGVAADAAQPVLGIDMLVAGGKTRGLGVFRNIAAANGLEVVAAGYHPRTGRYLVECRPA